MIVTTGQPVNSSREKRSPLAGLSSKLTQRIAWKDSPAIASAMLRLSNDSPFHQFVLLICRIVIAEYLCSGEKQYSLECAEQKPLHIMVNDEMTVKQLVLQIARVMKEAGYDPGSEWAVRLDIIAEYTTEYIDNSIGLIFNAGAAEVNEDLLNSPFCFSLSYNGPQLQGDIIYNEDQFPRALVDLTAARFLAAGGCFHDVNSSLVSLNRMGPYEKQLLDRFGAKDIRFDYNYTVHHHLEAGAARYPFRVAISCNDLHLTYSEVNTRANRIAHLLKEAGAGANTLVGLWMERSAEMMIAILGIWKSGAAYVPMDHKDPVERTGYLLRDAGINILVTRSSLFTAGDHVYEALATVQQVICVDELSDMAVQARQFITFRTAHLLQNGVERTIPDDAIFQFAHEIVTGTQLIQQAEKLVAALAHWRIQRIGICLVNPVYRILAYMVANSLFKEVVVIPADARTIDPFIQEHAIDTVFTESLFTSRVDLALRMQGALKQYVLLDEYQPGNQVKQQQVKQVWDMVAAGASFNINDYGWNNSYTGEKFSEAEMQEYIRNFSEKLQPFLANNKKVLEVGCGHGLVLFELAPKVEQYIATDLTPVIINRNIAKAAEAGLNNTGFYALPACDINKVQEKNFDLIICSSVIHYFPDTLYLEDVLVKMIALLDRQGIIYLDDVINLDKKQELIDSVKEFKAQHDGHKVKTNWDGDLMVSPSFFIELQAFFPEIVCIEITDKLGRIDNELTRFRYDIVLHIDKRKSAKAFPFGHITRNYLTRRDWEKMAPVNIPDRYVTEKQSARNLYDIKDIVQKPGDNISASFNPAQIAYLIYTSGSTGKPKGAIVEHQGMMNHIFSKIMDIECNESDVLAQVATHTFDISVWQFFTAIIAGARTVIIPEESIFHLPSFVRIINAATITVLELVPSYLSLLLDGTSGFLPSLHYLFVTGEEVKPQLIKRTAGNYPWLKLINAYGPTEASDDITHYFVEPDAITGKVPIGKPLPNCAIRIVNEELELCPVGATGEIWVSGVCVGKGYLNEIEKTNTAFVYRSFENGPAERFYRTGDLGKWLYNGQIEFLHRKDEQVKIHGHRIELGEIENCLLQYPDIKNVVVIVRQEKNDNAVLCAFYEAVDELSPHELRAHVTNRLPGYMTPSLFKRIDKIPITPNGKVDKKALRSVNINDSYLRFLSLKELEDCSTASDTLPKPGILPTLPETRFELGQQETEMILYEFNKPFRTSNDLFIDLFLQHVKTHGDHVAVNLGNVHLTYSGLDDQSRRLAAALMAKGVQPLNIVAVCLERSVDSIISLLGVIRSGAIYLFIEPSWPAERIRYVLQDSGASFVVTTGELKQRLFEQLPVPVTVLETGVLKDYDPVSAEAAYRPAFHDPVYIMYTSGSTGRPNGVLVEHRNLSSFLQAWQTAWQFDRNDKLLLISSLTFDVSIADIGSALISGSTIVLCTEQDLVQPDELLAIVQRSGVTVVDSVPSLMVKMGRFIFENKLVLPQLRLVIAGGDVFRSTDYNQLRQWLYPDIKIVNGYGPTEATIYASSYTPQGMEAADYASLSIGKPCGNANIFIVDAHNNLVPINTAGELVIGGAGVARGYLNKVELTHKQFVTISLPGAGELKIYKTGDRGLWKADGCIAFLGRNDQQVKINGYRVGLPEIEKVLVDHAQIDEAVVVLRTPVEELPFLAAYVVAKERLSTEDIRHHLSRSLPSYMIPSFVIQLESIPLTANGKRDRLKLQQFNPEEIITVLNDRPRNDRDERLRIIWSEILGTDKNRIGPETDFFELGATSFEVIILASRIKETFRVEIPVNVIFAKSRLKAISDQIAVTGAAGSMEGDYMVINEPRADRSKVLFLFPPLVAYGFIYTSLKEYFAEYALFAFNFIEEEDRVERYVQLIKEKQPQGPYILMGYSAPGELMAEIAASLEMGGDKVRLIFIDCGRTSRYSSYFRNGQVQQLEQAITAQKEALKNYGLTQFEEKLATKVTRYFEYLTRPLALKNISSDIYFIAAADRSESLQKHAAEINALPEFASRQSVEEIISYINWEHLSSGHYIKKQGHGKHGEMLSGTNLLPNITLIKQLISFKEPSDRHLPE